ncbi:DUF4245 family protein [Nocardioides yefusunii]|uniref:DUF4245 family protein n=1 Tax=Nocardioides yefusunii TaxID=2500546 RepID=A0ABW1QUF8_9ACTN|nr:DUF4245 family protein [Nocardioides yefusunii]
MSNKSRSGYESSFGGLIGAMIVMVALVLVFVGYRELFREVPETKPQHIENWRELADASQAEGHPIAVPEVPEEWLVTNIRFVPSLSPTWDIAMLTGDDKFAGVFQTDDRLDNVIEERVDKNAQEGEPFTVTGGDLAGEWRTFTDKGGDYALAHEDRSGVVLVFGSADEKELQDLANTLRTAPEGATSQSPAPAEETPAP